MLLSAGVVFHCLWYFLYITIPPNLHAKKLQLLPPRLSLFLSNSLPLPVQKWGENPLATLKGATEGRSHSHLSAPSKFLKKKECFFTGTASKDLKVSRIPLGVGISP